MIRLDVVICCYTMDRLQDVVAAATSIATQTGPRDTLAVVVDHNLELGTALAALLPGARLIENERPAGLSGARNTGVAAGDGDVVVFLDDDATAEPGMLDALRRGFGDPHVIGMGATIEPSWRGARPGWFPDEFLWVVGCTYAGLGEGVIRNPIGAGMAIRRRVFDTVGGFVDGIGRSAAGLPLGCEETELSIRAARAMPETWMLQSEEARCRHAVATSRGQWGYFLRRCYAEGLSKAAIGRLASGAPLTRERRYATRVLPAALGANILAACRGEPARIGRAAAIVLGFAATLAGFLFGRAAPAGLGRHRAMLSNAGALASGTVIAAALGFLFWWVAARWLPPASVGLAAAAISFANLVAHVGEVGLGPMLLGRLHGAKDNTGRMIATALVACLVISAACGLVAVAAVAALDHQLAPQAGPGLAAAFVAAVTVTAFTLVADQACVGLMRSDLQMLRNTAAAVAKLVLLIGLIAISGSATSVAALLAVWTFAQLASTGLLARRLGRPWPRAKASLMRPLIGEVFSHHVLNVALQAPTLALPFTVTVVVSPASNAAFYAAWSLIGVVLLIPASLATMVYTTGAREPHELAARLRLSLAISAACGLAAGFGLMVLGPAILAIFNPLYPSLAGHSLTLLGFGTLGVAIKYHYVAVARLQGCMNRISPLVAGLGALELAAAALGGRLGGLDGLVDGWLIAVALGVVAMLPRLVGAALRAIPALRLDGNGLEAT